MAHPTWLPYSFAALMATVSLYCIGRLALARPMGRRNHVDINVGHVLMGAGMVGMLVPRWDTIPDGLWEIAFGVLALYFLAQSVRFVAAHGVAGTDDNHVHHLSHFLIHMVMSCTMLYMYWLGTPVTTGAGTSTAMAMSGPPAGAGDPGLTLFLLAVLLASAVWQLDAVGRFAPGNLVAMRTAGAGAGTGGFAGEVTAPGTPESTDTRPWLAPRLEIWCHVAMCLTMGYMLVLSV